MKRLLIRFVGAAILIGVAATPAFATNIALNTSASGLPSPLGSDAGWGGGSYPWEIVDGQRTYSFWAHGLALSWNGTTSPGGTTTWASQAQIEFASPSWFNEVQLWHHSYYPTSNGLLDYWNGTAWVNIPYTRNLTLIDAGGAGSLQDIYNFSPVYGSKVRWTLPSGSSFCNGCANHVWLYEFEVYSSAAPVPEPASLVLFGSGLAGLAIWRRRRSR